MELGTVLAWRHASRPPVAGDTMGKALELGWVREFAEGQYLYTRPWAELFRTLQTTILSRAKSRLGFEEWIFPRVIPREALDSFRLTQFAGELLVQADRKGNSFLDPVQCISLYHFLRGAEIVSKLLPLKIVECLGGWTWRNETAERLDGPYRAKEFARVEHVYIGTPAQVCEIRRATRDSLTELLTELGLSWQVVVGSGCMDIPSVLKAQREATTADEVPVQDIEVPIRSALKDDGRRRPDFSEQSHYKLVGQELVEEKNEGTYSDSDEICGCSVEGDHLVSDFNIRASGGEQLWSGCCGMGINRLIVAFLYEHGFNKANWPEIDGRGTPLD